MILSLSQIRCCCSFFCHLSYLYLWSSYCYIYHIFSFWTFLFICPRCNKFTVIYLLLSKFNLSQMLEFDDFWELVTALFLKVSSLQIGGFCYLLNFLISETSSLLFLTYQWSSRIFQLGSLSILFLRSWMSPNVMYSSAGCEQVLELSRGRVSHE